jgi:hypothetical protein
LQIWDARKPRQTREFAAFHKQNAVFSGRMREMLTKYNMLWFCVDTYHRQRYFCICGLTAFSQLAAARTTDTTQAFSPKAHVLNRQLHPKDGNAERNGQTKKKRREYTP